MSDFGSRNMGFFGGSTTGGGGSSTGVNGLNGTTNIGLGGTLTSSTTILGNSGNYSLAFTDLLGFSVVTKQGWVLQNNDTNRQITAYSNIGFNSLDLYNNNLITNRASTFRILYNSIKSLFYPDPNGVDTNFGINIDFDLRTTSLGDIDNVYNQTKLILYDTSENIITYGSDGINGFWVSPSFTLFGSYNNTTKLYISIDYGLNSLAFRTTNDVIDGIELQVASKIYKFGSFNSGTTWIEVDDNATKMTFNTESLVFTGANLEGTAPIGLGVTWLKITLNGVEYSIECKETNL